jgi:hypothetical protein
LQEGAKILDHEAFLRNRIPGLMRSRNCNIAALQSLYPDGERFGNGKIASEAAFFGVR